MVFNWFKKKTGGYPEFWESYLICFDSVKDKKAPIRYVVFDTETTGLNYKNDVVLSIGAVAIQENRIKVNDYLELYLMQDLYKIETAAIHGILKNGKENKVTESEAITLFLDFIKDATLVGHHLNFDIEMINQSLKRIGVGKLKNKMMDTDFMYQKWKHLPLEQHKSLDELCDIFKVKKSDRHTASGDAFITALIFLKLKRKLE